MHNEETTRDTEYTRKDNEYTTRDNKFTTRNNEYITKHNEYTTRDNLVLSKRQETPCIKSHISRYVLDEPQLRRKV